MIRYRLLAGALLGASLAAPAAFGHAPVDLGSEAVDDLVRQADVIFEGRVVEVDYRMSEARSPDETALPHTFVTYELQSLVKGRAEVRQVTLRFIGGPDGRGRYLTVTDVPLFEEGDHDVLFVRGNGERQCPLVGCDDGRFQIRDELVFDAEGVPLFLDENGAIRASGQVDPRLADHALPAMAPQDLRAPLDLQGQLLENVPPELRQQLVDDWARAARERPVLRGQRLGSATTDQEATDGRQRLELETFLDQIRASVDRQQAEGGPVQTVQIDEPFSVRMPQPAEPPAAALEPRAEAGELESAQERRELELLQQQEGDPVIRLQ